MDSVYQADRAWLLDIQRKLYRWSRAEPGRLPGHVELGHRPPQPPAGVETRREQSRRALGGPGQGTVRDIQRREGPNGSSTGSGGSSAMELPADAGAARDDPQAWQTGQAPPAGRADRQDRVVQAALLQLLEPIFEADFLPVSYGFRPGRRVAMLWSTSATRSARPARRPRPIGRVRPINGSSKGTSGLLRPHRPPSRHDRLRRRVA